MAVGGGGEEGADGAHNPGIVLTKSTERLRSGRLHRRLRGERIIYFIMGGMVQGVAEKATCCTSRFCTISTGSVRKSFSKVSTQC